MLGSVCPWWAFLVFWELEGWSHSTRNALPAAFSVSFGSCENISFDWDTVFAMAASCLKGYRAPSILTLVSCRLESGLVAEVKQKVEESIWHLLSIAVGVWFSEVTILFLQKVLSACDINSEMWGRFFLDHSEEGIKNSGYRKQHLLQCWV